MGKNEKAFYWLVLSIFEKGSQNAPSKKDKTFQETQYFDHDHLSNFFHQTMWIFIMWTPCMSKIALNWLGLSIFEKGSQNAPHQKGKTFRETKFFDHVHISHFFPPKYENFIFGHPVWLK